MGGHVHTLEASLIRNPQQDANMESIVAVKQTLKHANHNIQTLHCDIHTLKERDVRAHAGHLFPN